MTFYSVKGNTFRQSANTPLNIKENLPPGTYTLKMDDFGFFYEMVDDFKLPGKVYGDLTSNRDRILNTYNDRTNATGVMLTGEKGSGKTLLSKAISIEAQARWGYPTILINAPWHGVHFNTLVQEMDQPAIFIFDEFEKLYDEKQQESLLTLFDGVYPTKKLFIITSNDKWKVDKHMRNRPGRVFYMLDYKGLSKEFIFEYAQDNLKNQDHVNSVVVASSLFSEMNFDMLKALIEEMNRYDEPAREAMRMLNTKPEYSAVLTYDVELMVDGVIIKKADMHASQYRGIPVLAGLSFDYDPNPADEDSDWVTVAFNPSHIIALSDDIYTYRNGNAQLKLTRVVAPTHNYMDRIL